MAETSWIPPGTVITTDYESGEAWIDVDNVKLDDSSNASVVCDKNEDSDWIRCTNFGIDSSILPPGAVITGVEFRIDRWASSSIYDKSIRMRFASGWVGDDLVDGVVPWNTSQRSDYYGGENDHWGTRISEEDVSGLLFGIDIAVQTGSGTQTMYIDYVAVKIYYEIGVSITIDRDRSRPNYAVSNFDFKTGPKDDSFNLLYWHIKCDDFKENNSDVLARRGPDANWTTASDTDRDTEDDSVLEIGRGRNLDTGGSWGHIRFDNLEYIGNDFIRRGALILKIKPKEDYDDPPDQYVFSIYEINSTDRIECYYESASDNFKFTVRHNSDENIIYSKSFSHNNEYQRQMVLHFVWTIYDDFIWIALDGEVQDYTVHDPVPQAADTDYFRVGSNWQRTNVGDFVIDEILAFKRAVLNGGAFQVASYGDGLKEDVKNPDKTLTFFWDCQASGAGAAKGGVGLANDIPITIGSTSSIIASSPILGTKRYWANNNVTDSYASFVNTGNAYIDPTEGALLLWFYISGWYDGRGLFGWKVDDNNYMEITLVSSDEIQFSYRLGGATVNTIVSSGLSLDDHSPFWLWARIDWIEGAFMRLTVAGQKVAEDLSPSGTWAGTGGTVYLGNNRDGDQGLNGSLGAVYVSNKAGNPEIWTDFGVPLNNPEVWIG